MLIGLFDTLDETLDYVVIWILDDSLGVVWVFYGYFLHFDLHFGWDLGWYVDNFFADFVKSIYKY